MSKTQTFLNRIALGVTLFLSTVLVSASSYAANLFLEQRTLDEQIQLISPHADIRIPETATGPVPAILMFHGCGGIAGVQEAYSQAILDAGYGVIIIDSMAARGIGRFEALSQVCAALRLWGQERASDVHAALAIAAADNRIDENNLVVAGWSHGGWTILEALTYAGENVLPPSLSETDTDLSQRIKAAILIYPYCGLPTRTNGEALHSNIPVYALLAERDYIAPNRDCVNILERAQQAGVEIDFEVWPGITHAFDKPDQSFDPRMEYNATASQRARSKVISILDQTFTAAG